MYRERGKADGDRDLRRIAEAIADEVVEAVLARLPAQPAEEDWIDSREVARRFGLSRAWVYDHARELGAVRIGDGPKARLRFVPSVVAHAIARRGRDAGAASTVESEPQSELGVPVHVPQIRSRRSDG